MNDKPHHAEVYLPDGGTRYGWQCLTCGDEIPPTFYSLAVAQNEADWHVTVAASRVPASGDQP